MRICIDARNITAQPAGIGRYAQSLIPALLDQASPSDELVLLRHDSHRAPLVAPDVARGRVQEVFVGGKIGSPADYLLGARHVHRALRLWSGADIYHDLFHVAPLGLRAMGRLGGPLVVTLHDLIWIDHPRTSQPTLARAVGMSAYARVAIPHTLRRAAHVICISEATRDRARPWLRAGQHSVISHGVEPRYFAPQPAPGGEVGAALDSGARYVLAVGNAKPYKNLSALIEAFAKLVPGSPKLRLVLVGDCEALRPKVQRLGLERRVILTGMLQDQALCEVLAHASLFVFPSLVEGFGLPPLEAMAAGVPCVVSELEPMRAVVAGGARLVNPRDVAAMAAAMREVLEDEAQAMRWRTRGLERARALTWEACARQTLDVYRAVIEAR